MRRWLGLMIALAVSLSAAAQVRVTGYVREAHSGEAVIGATVYLSDKSVGVATDGFGFYSLSLKPGTYEIVCSSIGYADSKQTVECKSGTVKLDFFLDEDRQVLESAKVFSRSKKDALMLPQMGVQTVDVELVHKLPALMGETDIIRVIQMLPGVQSPSEGSTGFSVRGGGEDQNLILMDGAPVYQSGHFLGFVSMFNGDIVKNVQLYKGDFPTRFGGKMSSVLEVTTVDGNANDFSGNISVGLLTSKASIGGPIVPGKLSFSLAARRSYMDLFFPFIKDLPKGTKLSF